jgi:hypothetical protein
MMCLQLLIILEAPSWQQVGGVQRMLFTLFTLAAMFLYPIVSAAVVMPEQTRIIRNVGQEMPRAEALRFVKVHDRIIGG